MLAPERWARVRGLLETAVELPPPERLAYLSDACPDDPVVRSEVESLLRAHEVAGTFLDPAPSSDHAGLAAGQEPALPPGCRLGHFEIVSELGAGGMGRVYRARDTRLDRTVALKVIAPALAGEPWHRARFEREARAISRLAHPHICVLHDVGQAIADGRDRQFLIMELVEGEPLSARLARGALPVDAAIELAGQMAGALAAAHAAGIVHGDLKPANVMLTKRGVKLLDFGLARLHDSGTTARPGATSTERQPGTIAGTVPYMAPEQLRGEDGDARSDLFAFGAVVFEMLTGRRAFTGESWADIATAILERDPPNISDVEPGVPSSLARLVSTCLARDPADRWQSAHDVALRLREAQDASHQAEVARTARSRMSAVVGWVIAAAALAAAGWQWVSSADVGGSSHGAPRRLMLDAAPVAAGQAWAPMLSPDGRAVAFVAGREGGDRFVVTRLDSGETRQFPARPGGCAWGATWSLDGDTLFYGAGDALFAASTLTGATQKVAGMASGPPTFRTGVTRNPAGVVLMGGRRLMVLSPRSDVLEVRPDPGPGITAQLYPSFLPDGRAFVFTQTATDPNQEGVFLGSLDSPRSVRLIPAVTNAHVSSTGHLVYAADGSILARRLDLSRHALEGDAVTIATDVQSSGQFTHFALGADETIAYVQRHSGVMSRLRWIDRDGAARDVLGEPFPYRQIALARDARRAVAESDGKAEPANLWLIDLARGTMVRADMSTQTEKLDAAWAPDGRRLAFTGWVDGDAELFTMTLDSTEPPVQLAKVPGAQWAQHWTSDGRWVLYVQTDSTTKASLWGLPVEDGGSPRVLIDSPFAINRPEVSPDNRWLAYVSDESGRHEVYVQRWGNLGERWKVSSDGGGQPKWRADGRELFYVALDATMMAVAVPPDGLPGEPRPLFRAPLEPDAALNKYAVTPDGRRFLVISPIESTESARLVVVSNWPALLEK